MATAGQKSATPPRGLPTLARLETFTDAVFAVVMTILVLDIKSPEITAAMRQDRFDYSFLVHHAPKFLAFFASFFMLASAWTWIVPILRLARHVTTAMTWLTLTYLSFICLVPWATAFWSENPSLPQSSVALFVLWMLLFRIGRSLAKHVIRTFCPEDPIARFTLDLGAGLFVLFCALALITAFVTVYAGIVALLFFTVTWAIPKDVLRRIFSGRGDDEAATTPEL